MYYVHRTKHSVRVLKSPKGTLTLDQAKVVLEKVKIYLPPKPVWHKD